MKALIIDRDTLCSQMIKTKLEALGHDVSEIQSKDDAPEIIAKEKHDLIIMDPAPLNSARPITMNIRRSVPHYPYIIMTSESMSLEQALKDSANDLLSKPIDKAILNEKLDNASFMLELMRRIGDTNEDFPSAGGIIAKSAFNQLFISAMERADRYGENSFILFIGIDNYREVKEMDGPYAADYAAANLSKTLVKLRRQSDIIAQTGKAEFALLLQRPLYETEPHDAANRFGENLAAESSLALDSKSALQISVRLINAPTGASIVLHNLEF